MRGICVVDFAILRLASESQHEQARVCAHLRAAEKRWEVSHLDFIVFLDYAAIARCGFAGH
jgi:hypothetical protein